MKPFTAVAMVLLALLAVAQLVRFAMNWEVLVNGVEVPVWASAVVAPVAAVIAAMIWRENRPTAA